MVDYDLVVIGRTPAGVAAAMLAAHLKARVALVEQPALADQTAFLGRQILTEVGTQLQQGKRSAQLGLWPATEVCSGLRPSPIWQALRQWEATVAERLKSWQTVAIQSSLGIDEISGSGEFCRKPLPAFIVNGRYLRSRAYLLALPEQTTVPAIPGLEAAGYLTPATLLHSDQPVLQPQQQLMILGSNPVGVELAQAFGRLGLKVTLAVASSQLLPEEDPDSARFIQAQLEAEGVQILTGADVTQVRLTENGRWVSIGNQELATDAILLATPPLADLAALNLEAVQVQWDNSGIQLNRRLQTTNPRIYACSGHWDNHWAPQLAVYQAQIAVKNALFWPLLTVDMGGLPSLVKTDPELVRLGLTEPQAVARYGRDVRVVRQPLQSLPKAQISGLDSGFCKLITRRNGRLLGAHLVGPQAGEWAGAIALALQRQLKIQDLAKLTCPTPTFSEIIQQTALAWQRQHLAQNPSLQDWLQGFFDWRRSWTRFK